MNLFRKTLFKLILPILIPIAALIYIFPPEKDKTQTTILPSIKETLKTKDIAASKSAPERDYSPQGAPEKCENIFDKSKNHIGIKCFDKRGRLHGEYIKKYKNGVTALQGEYNHGKRTGNWWEMSKNNNILFAGKFWQGQPVGWVKTYYDRNKKTDRESIRSECFYIDGKKTESVESIIRRFLFLVGER